MKSDRGTALVTGANAGIGHATSIGLARQGFRVAMLCRDRERGETALAAAKAEVPEASFELVLGDLSRPIDARRAAQEVARRFPDLRVLLNNAAILPRTHEVTADGLELQFAVNHLAYMVLADELLDTLSNNQPARIVNVASEAHRRGQLDLDDLQASRRYRPRPHYNTTKLMNVLFSMELARRIEGTGVTSNALHPGVIPTGLLRSFLGLPAIARPMLRMVLSSEETGAKTSIHVASAPDLEGINGRYFRDCRELAPSTEALDPELARELWDRTQQILSEVDSPR